MALPLTVTFEAIVRLLVGIFVVLYLLPRGPLSRFRDLAAGDRLLIGAVCGCLALVIAGYALAAARLYEWISLAVVLALGTYALRAPAPRLRPPGARLASGALAQLDHLAGVPQRLLAALVAAGRRGRRLRLPGQPALLTALVGLALLGVATWMRWWVNLTHAAPMYSDFVVVLAWVKKIDEQSLFPDGIYLKGFHLIVAGLAKLTLAHPDVFVKYAGPAVGVGMVLGVAYFAYRVTGRPVAALLALFIYGTLPAVLPYDVVRQAATDSQEFGNMLVLPAAWLVYRAWTRPDVPGYRLGAAAIVTLIATIHPIAILNAAGAVVAATVAAAVERRLSGRVLWALAGLLAVGAAVAVLPPGIALLRGTPFYASSAAFATAAGAGVVPPVPPLALVGLGCAVAAAVVGLLRRHAEAAGPPVLAGGVLAFALAIQQAPRFGLDSQALASRSGELLAMAVAAALALGWSAAEQLLEAVAGRRPTAWISLGALAALAAGLWLGHPPAPLSTYHMDSDEFVANYVRIAREFPATDWLAVSDQDGYDYALGAGYFQNPEPFLSHVAPEGAWPAYTDGGTSTPLEDYIFIFIEKQFWVAPLPSEQARLPARQEDSAALQKWVDTWQAQHNDVQVFFNGTYLKIYELQRPQSATATLQRLFGG